MPLSPRSRRMSTRIVALAGAVSLALGLHATAVAATTALIVPGTGTSNPAYAHNFESNAYRNYIRPGTDGCGDNACPGVTFTPVPYDASLWPLISSKGPQASSAKWDPSVVSGARDLQSLLGQRLATGTAGPIVIFGYSQGSTVASHVKSQLRNLPLAQRNRLSFVLIANPNRPNGGVIERPAQFGYLPIADIRFGPPTRTDVGIATRDIAIQYDGISDFPAYPLNALAVANALMGTALIHPSYLQPKGNGAGAPAKPRSAIYGYSAEGIAAQQDCTLHPANCQRHGDTTYVTVPTHDLPLLAPLRQYGERSGRSDMTTPLADLVQPALRVLIETGYDRTDYSKPTPLQLGLNPAKVATLGRDLNSAVAVGLRDAQAARNKPGRDRHRPVPPLVEVSR